MMSKLPVMVRCGPLRFLEPLRCCLVVGLTNLTPPQKSWPPEGVAR
ncbi:MAG: hypothetical protein ABJA89_01990 [Lapillicoccus sp.]